MADSVGSAPSTSFLLPGSSNRMFGLASGLDIDSMVSKLMQAEEVPLDQLKQQQQLLQWKQDDYRSMNSSLLDLYNSTFNMTLQSSYLTKTAESSDDTLISATASSGAGNTSFSINGGTVASAANITSGAFGTNFDPSKSLWENRNEITSFSSNYSLTTVAAYSKTVSANGTTFNIGNKLVDDTSISATTSTIDVTDSNGTVITTYHIDYNQSGYDSDTSTNKVLINTNTGDMTFSGTLTQGSIIKVPQYKYATINSGALTSDIKAADSSGKIVDKSFTFTADQSLNDIIGDINNSGLNVTSFYGSGSKQISITSKSTGNLSSSDDIAISGNLFTSNFGFSTTGVNGTDAELNINNVKMTSHTNTFNIDNVTFTLKKTFTSTESVNITNDTTDIFNKIKDWVGKYNDTIQKINDKISEKRNRDYPPLTDGQKQTMKDSDITLWNDKAMSGMLSDDQLLPSGLDQMRMDIYSPVSSVSNTDYNQLTDIGITTSTNYSDNGKLIIDEAKLKAAIAADPTSVMKLFTNTGIPSGGTDPVYGNEGIMMRLQTSIQNTMNSIYQVAGKDTYTYDKFSLGKSIHDYGNQISDMMTHLHDVQNRYYTQFTAMEQAIQQANQQGSFISQNFAG